MKIIFRVDAYANIGLGHLMRCLALADSFQKNNTESLFVSSIKDDSYFDIVRQRKHRVAALGKHIDIPAEVDVFNSLINKESPDAIILDGYNFNYSYQEKIETKGALLICMGWDKDYRSHADIVINQNLWASKNLYSGKVPLHTKFLLGTRYVLLPESYRQTIRKGNKECENILLTFGGGQYSNLGLRLYDGLRDLPYHFTLVVGPYTNVEIDTTGKNISIIKGLSNLYPVLIEADLAITACGSTSWELCCVGVPFITYVLSNNQEQNAFLLQEHGASVNMGWSNNLNLDTLRKTVNYLAEDYQKREDMGCRGRQLVDGYGADRAAKSIIDSIFQKENRCN